MVKKHCWVVISEHLEVTLEVTDWKTEKKTDLYRFLSLLEIKHDPEQKYKIRWKRQARR